MSGASSSAWPRLKRQTYRWSNRRRSEGRYRSENGHSVSSLGGKSSAIAVIGPVASEGQLLVALRSLHQLLRRTTAVRLPEDSTRPVAAGRTVGVPRAGIKAKRSSERHCPADGKQRLCRGDKKPDSFIGAIHAHPSGWSRTLSVEIYLHSVERTIEERYCRAAPKKERARAISSMRPGRRPNRSLFSYMACLVIVTKPGVVRQTALDGLNS